MKGICTYWLIQQTPMIHFQSREPGACLRASEMKPKLDKFLGQMIPDIPQNWYIDKNQSLALNYKVKIHTDEKSSAGKPDRNLFFGNTGKGLRKKTVIYRKPIKITIVCFNDSLMNAIKEHLEAFFLLHNFGTRQNKGFGSFVLKATVNRKDTDKLLSNYINSSCNIYKITYNNTYNNQITYKDIFKDIATFSSVLKSGYNNKGIYIKSYLVKHCLDADKHNGEKIGGDKRWLKSTEINMAPRIEKNPRNSHEAGTVTKYRYNRALLGTAGNLAFKNSLTKNEMTKIGIVGKDEVKRIPSPVLYKIVGNVLYMIVRQHSDIIYGKRFQFKKKTQKDGRNLLVPEKGEVDIQIVFRDYVQEVNDLSSDYYKSLKGMLTFLKQEQKIIELKGE